MPTAAEAYERYMGRWSRRLAPVFLKFVQVLDGDHVLDVGCGTGAVALTLAATTRLSRITGVDCERGYIEYAQAQTSDPRVKFVTGDAHTLPVPGGAFDVTLAQLVLNFLVDPRRAVREMRLVTRPGGRVAACVMDYSEGQTMHRLFWDTAVTLDPEAGPVREARMRFSRKGLLPVLLAHGGLERIEETVLEFDTPFADFDDFWTPILDGRGSAPAYVASLPPYRQAALRERLRAVLLGGRPDGPFVLWARAWAARGLVPR